MNIIKLHNYITKTTISAFLRFSLPRKLRFGSDRNSPSYTCNHRSLTFEVHVVIFRLQLSFGSSSPILSDQSRFPKFFRIAAPDQKHTNARIDLLRKYNWMKVATIHQALEFFSVVSYIYWACMFTVRLLIFINQTV